MLLALSYSLRPLWWAAAQRTIYNGVQRKDLNNGVVSRPSAKPNGVTPIRMAASRQAISRTGQSTTGPVPASMYLLRNDDVYWAVSCQAASRQWNRENGPVPAGRIDRLRAMPDQQIASEEHQP